LRSTGGVLSVGNIATGGTINLAAAGNLTTGTLNAGSGQVVISSTSGIITVTGPVRTTTGSFTLNTTKDINLPGGFISTGGGALNLTTTGGGLNLGAVSTTGPVTLSASGQLSLTSLTGGAQAVSLISTNERVVLGGTLSTTSGAITLWAQNDVLIDLIRTQSGLIKVTSNAGSIQRTHLGTNIIASTRPQLQAAKIVDVTVQADSALVNTSEIFRRPSSSTIIIYVVFS
jgi:hypothetical protein